eukprot:CAMPEP_0119015898 /NCGR_PEP_ID=MMETSP1176-20130426/11711_1 /TAXON_ID=265551 /ORGANISM="Synedropsis recta cf, Strain CCMP1620" /LENGTH=170 /DNA_ID=CAMNT_0006969223 /DNA_START=15 /DNA_END=527 /DNA_ORIENTATION=+
MPNYHQQDIDDAALVIGISGSIAICCCCVPGELLMVVGGIRICLALVVGFEVDSGVPLVGILAGTLWILVGIAKMDKKATDARRATRSEEGAIHEEDAALALTGDTMGPTMVSVTLAKPLRATGLDREIELGHKAHDVQLFNALLNEEDDTIKKDQDIDSSIVESKQLLV